MSGSKPFRWGIAGTGRIVHRWLPDLFRIPGAQLAAICSTSMDKARGIAEQYAPKARCFDSMEDFVGSGVDAVYIATSHVYHLEGALACLEAGLPVLCEKPITPTAAQAKVLAKANERTGTFLMEAFWTRFFAVTDQVLRWLEAGEIGEIVHMQGGFTGVHAQQGAGDRLLDPAAGGGALLDIGVYPIQCAAIYAGGMPESAQSFATLGPTGVDTSAAILLRFPGGATANLFSSFRAKGHDDFTILGTKGKIVIDAPFWRPKAATLSNGNGETLFRDPDGESGEGFQYEALHVQDCVAKGLSQSPVMPLSRSVEVLELCDRLRESWGLRYPFEGEA